MLFNVLQIVSKFSREYRWFKNIVEGNPRIEIF